MAIIGREKDTYTFVRHFEQYLAYQVHTVFTPWLSPHPWLAIENSAIDRYKLTALTWQKGENRKCAKARSLKNDGHLGIPRVRSLPCLQTYS